MWLSEECKKMPSLEYFGKAKTDKQGHLKL